MDEYAGLLELVPEELRGRSGGVFYSGREAFIGSKPLYILGLNPGGDPKRPGRTIQDNLDTAKSATEPWSVFAVGKPLAGKERFHARVLHLLKSVQPTCDPCCVPASNVVFVRSRRESDLLGEKDELLKKCWPFHQEVVKRLGVRVILCLGATAGKWVGEQVGASLPAGTFEELNRRKWTSRAHKTRDGLRVLTLTHPSIADWTSTATDPSPLVRQCLADARAKI